MNFIKIITSQISEKSVLSLWQKKGEKRVERLQKYHFTRF